MVDCQSGSPQIPTYTPVSTFDSDNYVAIGAQSGIFLGCHNSGIKVKKLFGSIPRKHDCSGPRLHSNNDMYIKSCQILYFTALNVLLALIAFHKFIYYHLLITFYILFIYFYFSFYLFRSIDIVTYFIINFIYVLTCVFIYRVN